MRKSSKEETKVTINIKICLGGNKDSLNKNKKDYFWKKNSAASATIVAVHTGKLTVSDCILLNITLAKNLSLKSRTKN